MKNSHKVTELQVHDARKAVEGYISQHLFFTFAAISEVVNLSETRLRRTLAELVAQRKLEQVAPNAWRH